MSEKRTINIITKWDNVINLDCNVNKFVKCQMCGEMINENIAIYKEDEGYYCSSCNERIYRNSETEKLKELTNILKNEEISISVTSSEEFDIVVLFLEKLTEEPHCEEICGCDFYIDESQEICLSIKDGEWVYATRKDEDEHNVKVISYKSIKSIIEKELDR